MSFYPEFKKCPICDGDKYVVDAVDGCVRKCDYCWYGKVAIYSQERTRLSKIILCHPKFQEPDDAKSKIIHNWLNPFK